MINPQKIGKRLNLNPIDKITLGYIISTLIFIIFSIERLECSWLHIFLRFFLIALIFFLARLTPLITSNAWLFIRNSYPLILFGFFYAETDYLNNILFSNLDLYFEKVELLIFGIHPSVIFSQSFPQVWFGEIMNFGYFSYYFLILLLPLWLWVKKKKSFYYVIFIISLSFYLFYWIFILFPVAGPQYYLAESLRTIPDTGLFRSMVKFAEWIGEGPTAAFPSSHVGVIVIISYLSYKYARELFLVYLLFGLLICFSTVYIKAHYAIDVIGGVVIAPIFYLISDRLYRLIDHS